MKKLFPFLLLFYSSLQAQSPYTGGNGSGYTLSLSAVTVCPNFYGGSADGAADNVSALTICPPFFGGNGDGYGGTVLTNCFAPLPVKILSFTGQHEDTHNTIRWQIDAGYEVKEFIVERSTDRFNFTAIGKIKETTIPSFHFTMIDPALIEAVYFYRLRIIEINGDITYSNTIALRAENKTGMYVFPNPAGKEATLYLSLPKPATEIVRLYNTSNQLMVNKKYALAQGSNFISFDLSSLPSGIYFICIGSLPAIKLVKK